MQLLSPTRKGQFITISYHGDVRYFNFFSEDTQKVTFVFATMLKAFQNKEHRVMYSNRFKYQKKLQIIYDEFSEIFHSELLIFIHRI